MTERDRICIDPNTGNAIIKGSRITVERILRKIAEGANEQALLDAYPHLTAGDGGSQRSARNHELSHRARIGAS